MIRKRTSEAVSIPVRPRFLWPNLLLLFAGVAATAWWIDSFTDWSRPLTGSLSAKLIGICAVCAVFLLFGTAYKEHLRKLALPVLGSGYTTGVITLLLIVLFFYTDAARTVELQATPEHPAEVVVKWSGSEKEISVEAKKQKRVLLFASLFSSVVAKAFSSCRGDLAGRLEPFSTWHIDAEKFSPLPRVVIRGARVFVSTFVEDGGVEPVDLVVTLASRQYRVKEYRGAPVTFGNCTCLAETLADPAPACVAASSEVHGADAVYFECPRATCTFRGGAIRFHKGDRIAAVQKAEPPESGAEIREVQTEWQQ